MSNLSLYKGNFLEFVDKEFNDSSDVSKEFRGVSEIDLSVMCSIAVLPSQDDCVGVEISTGDVSDFKIYQDANRLVISQNGSSGSTCTINGVSFSGNSVTMVNGDIWIDGRKVDPSKSEPPKKQAQIRIFAPANLSLVASLKGVGILASKVIFSRSRINLSGSSTIGLATRALKLNLSGQGESFIVMKNGDLKVDLSGQGSVRIKGEWQEADVEVSGMGHIYTDGTCNSDYWASVSGMGSISHSGKIFGQVHKNVSGMGSIKI